MNKKHAVCGGVRTSRLEGLSEQGKQIDSEYKLLVPNLWGFHPLAHHLSVFTRPNVCSPHNNIYLVPIKQIRMILLFQSSDMWSAGTLILAASGLLSSVSARKTSIYIDQIPLYSKLPECAEKPLSAIVRAQSSGCGDSQQLTSFSCFCLDQST